MSTLYSTLVEESLWELFWYQSNCSFVPLVSCDLIFSVPLAVYENCISNKPPLLKRFPHCIFILTSVFDYFRLMPQSFLLQSITFMHCFPFHLFKSLVTGMLSIHYNLIWIQSSDIELQPFIKSLGLHGHSKKQCFLETACNMRKIRVSDYYFSSVMFHNCCGPSPFSLSFAEIH